MRGSEALIVTVPKSAPALETAFLSSGLPADVRPTAVERIKEAVRARRLEPGFVGVIDGTPTVGLDDSELARIANAADKFATRDLPVAMARGLTGGTTVSATIFLANRAGFQVAATGGIGGVHRSSQSQDVSPDLYELARTPIALVCSGAKAILDLPSTLERLETLGITVVGLGTDELPAFWSGHSGLPLSLSVDDVAELAAIWQRARELDAPGALVVCVPPPGEIDLPREEAERAVQRALADLEGSRISGPAVTPFLLDRVARYTEGRSVRANVALLENNAAVAADLARELGGKGGEN